MNKRWMWLVALMLAAQAAWAQDEEEELGWSGQGELGYVAARGNSDTETLNLGATAIYNLNVWRHTFNVFTLRAEDSGTTTAERFGLGAQTDYKVSDISYWFGSLRYESDEFSQFESQTAAGLGYGRTLIDTGVHNLVGELGVGVRRDELRGTGDTDTGAIAIGALNYIWTISDTANFTNALRIEAGGDNTFASNLAALTTQIYQDLGVKLGYEIRHNTDVDAPFRRSDRLTTVSLVYDF